MIQFDELEMGSTQLKPPTFSVEDFNPQCVDHYACMNPPGQINLKVGKSQVQVMGHSCRFFFGNSDRGILGGCGCGCGCGCCGCCCCGCCCCGCCGCCCCCGCGCGCGCCCRCRCCCYCCRCWHSRQVHSARVGASSRMWPEQVSEAECGAEHSGISGCRGPMLPKFGYCHLWVQNSEQLFSRKFVWLVWLQALPFLPVKSYWNDPFQWQIP